MRKKGLSWRRIGFLVIIGLLVVALSAGCSQTPTNSHGNTTNKGTITIGYVNWSEDVAVSNLWQQLLQDNGYTVELKALDVAPLFVGLGNNNLNVFMDSWLPITHEAYWKQYKDKLDDYGTWYQGEAKIGVVVPKYVTIDSIDQLNTNKDKFNGEIIGIDAGAGTMKTAAKAINDYSLNYRLVQGSEAAMMAAMDKAYKANKWVAITGWSPHWMFAKYNLKYLNDPKQDFGAAEGIHTLANKQFTKDMPQVAQMLKNFKMTDQQIGSLESLINDGMSPNAAAKKWISENKALVDSWTK